MGSHQILKFLSRKKCSGNKMRNLLVVRGERWEMTGCSNVLVLNLATSDLVSALTLPSTAMDALWHHWPLASQSVLACRLVKVVPCMAVFMSSFTIIAIAVDRHRMICKPTFRQVSSSQHTFTSFWTFWTSYSLVSVCLRPAKGNLNNHFFRKSIDNSIVFNKWIFLVISIFPESLTSLSRTICLYYYIPDLQE